MGIQNFKDHLGFEKATSYKKFIPEIEIKLNKWIETKLEIFTLNVDLGRKEFEEFLLKNTNQSIITKESEQASNEKQ